MPDTREFEVWERRDAHSAWGPLSAADDHYLRVIEEGFHEVNGIVRDNPADYWGDDTE